MRTLAFAAIVTFAAFGVGCSQDSTKASTQEAAASATSAAVEKLKLEIQDLRSKVEAIGVLETKVDQLEFSMKENQTSWFDPTANRGFGRVDANVGYFLVTLENVQPYLDGQKVTLLIGNPNNVTFSGFEIKASWSARIPDPKSIPAGESVKAFKAYVASRGEKVIKLTDTLRPGLWNKVSFTIAPVKAEEFGSLGIAITTNQVSLAGGR